MTRDQCHISEAQLLMASNVGYLSTNAALYSSAALQSQSNFAATFAAKLDDDENWSANRKNLKYQQYQVETKLLTTQY